MKLYVWQKVLCGYTCGVAFALAPSADEARQLILANTPEGWEREYIASEIVAAPDVYDSPFGLAVAGGG